MARRGGLALVGGLLVLAGTGYAVWNFMAPGTPSPNSSSFGFEAWLVRCETAGDKAGCGMSQRVMDQRSSRPVLQLHLGRAPKGEGHQLVAVLPLGVSVPQGIAIEIGKTKRNVAFTQCLPGGCVAPLAVDQALAETMKAGGEGRVGVVDREGKTVAVPFSLKGFAPAFKKMEEQSGIANGDATWWTRFWNSSGTQ
jgi:invasion protein IalB